MNKQQKELYLTHEEAIQTEIALNNTLKQLLIEYDEVEGEEAKEAARSIIKSHRTALEKVKDINRKFSNEYENI